MKEKQTKKKKDGKRFLIPIILILGFVPLIVHMRQYDAGMEKYLWFPDNSNIRVDMFMAYKSYAIMLLAGIMLLILIIQAVKHKKDFRMETSYYLLLIYAIFVIMSGLFSVYKPQVFTGSYEIFQPMEVIIGYLLISFYTYQYADSVETIKWILSLSAIGLVIMIFIGISQFIGIDFLQTTLGRILISDTYHLDKLDTINFSLPKHTVYATLYNPDFLSFYFGIIAPIVLAVFVNVSKISHKIICAILFICCIICLVGAGASAGYIAFAAEMIIGLYILLSRKKKAFIWAIIIGLACVLGGIIVCMTTSLGSRVNQLFWGSQRSIETRLIKSIETTDNDVCFHLEDREVHVSYDVDQDNGQFILTFADEDGNQLEADIVNTDNGVAYQLQDSTLGNCQAEPIIIEDELALHVNMDGYDWYFKKVDNDGYYYYNPFGKWEKIAEVKKANIFRDNAFSGRGNIWNLTIPLLGKHVIMGSGANTFGFELPQNDYVYKTYKGLTNQLVAKAHNWFLQEWIENGLIATLCLFGFLIWYLIRSIRIYRHCDLHNQIYLIGFGVFVGTIGYMIAGMASDSNICTAPVFWVLLAIGMSINRMYLDEQKTLTIESPNTEVAQATISPTEPVQVTTHKSNKKQSRRDRKKAKK